MSFDPITYDAVSGLSRRITSQRIVHYVFTSQQWTARKNCIVNVRALSAGGGASTKGGGLVNGNGGTFAFKRVRLQAGDQMTVTIGGGAPSFTYSANTGTLGGVAGGATVVQCAAAGLNLNVPGGQPGNTALLSQTGLRQNPANAAPTGADWHMACTPAGMTSTNQTFASAAPVVHGLVEEGGAADAVLRALWDSQAQLSPDSLPLLAAGGKPPAAYNTIYTANHLASLGVLSLVPQNSTTYPIVGRGAGAGHWKHDSGGFGGAQTSHATPSGAGMVTLEIFEEE